MLQCCEITSFLSLSPTRADIARTLGYGNAIGLDALAEVLLEVKMHKNKSITMSNWESNKFTSKMIV